MNTLLPLDPLLMTELRLSIMSILVQREVSDFSHIKAATGATAGNISVQIDKLAEAGYLSVEKGFVGKRPQTTYNLTEAGRQAFERHFEALMSYRPN